MVELGCSVLLLGKVRFESHGLDSSFIGTYRAGVELRSRDTETRARVRVHDAIEGGS
jgi:hypothetical protein